MSKQLGRRVIRPSVFEPHETLAFRKGWQMALQSVPMLSAAIADFRVFFTEDVPVAAVEAKRRFIFINPRNRFSFNEYEWLFVIVHEVLHVAFEHATRMGARDAKLWNIACDYVINSYIVRAGIGHRPVVGLFDDENKYTGLSSEDVYQTLLLNMQDESQFVNDMSDDILDIDIEENTCGVSVEGVPDVDDIYDHEQGDDAKDTQSKENHQGEAGKKLEMDSLGQSLSEPMKVEDIGEYFRQKVLEGYKPDPQTGLTPMRGDEPVGLLKELSIQRPANPFAWKVEFGKFLSHSLSAREKVWTYMRPSRRQTPALTLQGVVLKGRGYRYVHEAVFGVLLDTSGSMSRSFIAEAMRTAVAYAIMNKVQQVRLIQCDAEAYDMGLVNVSDLMDTFTIKGGGGTVLQEAVKIFDEDAQNFPVHAPILVITDGFIDELHFGGRYHAYLLPEGNQLPFTPPELTSRVFYVNCPL